MLTDGARGLINMWTGGAGAKPANAQEAVSLIDADIRKMEAIAKLDAVHGDVSMWVSNIRALQRPVSAAVVLLSWGIVLGIYGDANIDTTINIVSNLASSVIFYLFGDRTYMHFKKERT
jgi:hypothetical protein